MKKFLKSLIAIALLFTMAMSVTACKKSKKESDDDSKQSQAFPAAEVVVANFKKVGYDVDADAECGYEFGVAIVLCVEGWDDGDDWLEIYYVASASDAKAMLTAFEIEYWEEIQEECSEYGVKAVKGTSGSVFYFGTENALKVAKTGKAPAVSESTSESQSGPILGATLSREYIANVLRNAGYLVTEIYERTYLRETENSFLSLSEGSLTFIIQATNINIDLCNITVFCGNEDDIRDLYNEIMSDETISALNDMNHEAIVIDNVLLLGHRSAIQTILG